MTDLTRRELLLRGMTGAGLLAIPGVLAACGGGGIDGAASATSASTAAIDRTLADKIVISNWPLYIDIDEKTKKSPTLEGFTEKTGVQVEYIEDVNSNEEFFGKVQGPLSQGQSTGRDVAILSGYMVNRMKVLGYLETFDVESIPNMKNITTPVPAWDPKREWGVPWQSYMTGIGYNSAKISTITSIDELLTDPALKGKVTFLNEMGDTMGLMLLAAGSNPEKVDEAAFGAAIEKLQKAVSDGQIRQFTGNDYTGPLAKGDIWAALAWSGDIVQLQADNDKLRFASPDAGGIIATDYICIPKGGNAYTASVFADYSLDPVIAAQISLYVNYITPVGAAKAEAEKVDPGVAANTLIFPDAATFAKLKEFEPAAYDNKKLQEQFQAVLGA